MIFIVLYGIWVKNLILNFLIRFSAGIYEILDKFPFAITLFTKS